MRLSPKLSVLLASASVVDAFAPLLLPSQKCLSRTTLFSTVEDPPLVSSPARVQEDERKPLTGEAIRVRHEREMERLRQRDRKSKALLKEDLNIVYEDEHIVVVDKPSGVLSVPTREGNPSLSQAVFDAIGCEMGRADMMVVHRLGMETSGLMVLAKTRQALRGLNSSFRTRQVKRQYEALVCGHVKKNKGFIDLPIMRDYEYPPYMRISTDEHQRALLDLDPMVVGKKLLENPKESLTKYEVVSREELEGQPVSRVTLTSISGRTHQLNVHCAAFGHPIVGDKTYGFGGDAAPNGGLTKVEQDKMVPNKSRADDTVLKNIAVQGKPMSVHAKLLSFRHPVTKEHVLFRSQSPF